MFDWKSLQNIIWAPSSEFVSSSIPSWQTSTAHAQPFRGARDLVFRLKVPLDSLLVWASSEGSGETARMRRLAWTFAARIGDKYQSRLTRSIYDHCSVALKSRSIFRLDLFCKERNTFSLDFGPTLKSMKIVVQYVHCYKTVGIWYNSRISLVLCNLKWMLLAFITENLLGEAILMNTHIIVLWSRGCESNEYLQHTIL